MKRSIIALMIAFVCLTGAADDNLIKNPEFKVSAGSQKTDNWITGKVEGVTPNALEGKQSIKIAVDYKEESREYYRGNLSQTIGKLVPGEYELSACFRGDLSAVFVILRDAAGSAKTDFMLRSWIPCQKFVPAANAPGWFKFYSKIVVRKEISNVMFIFQGEAKKKSSFEVADIQLYQTN